MFLTKDARRHVARWAKSQPYDSSYFFDDWSFSQIWRNHHLRQKNDHSDTPARLVTDLPIISSARLGKQGECVSALTTRKWVWKKRHSRLSCYEPPTINKKSSCSKDAFRINKQINTSREMPAASSFWIQTLLWTWQWYLCQANWNWYVCKYTHIPTTYKSLQDLTWTIIWETTTSKSYCPSYPASVT